MLKVLRSRVDDSISSADTRQSIDHASFKSVVTDQQEYVTNVVGTFTASMQHTSDMLQQQSQDVDHFLSAELQQDVPTGSITIVLIVRDESHCLADWVTSLFGSVFR